jgi:hypothetical protein
LTGSAGGVETIIGVEPGVRGAPVGALDWEIRC